MTSRLLYLILVMTITVNAELIQPNPVLGVLPGLKNLEYSDPELRRHRDEVSANIQRAGKSENVDLVFRHYRIRKEDNFFKVMARTMLDHDTLSSVNLLASLWDFEPGQLWLVPNARGIAVTGNPEEISLKYKISRKYIFPIPGSTNRYFIVSRSFHPSERDFLSGTVFIKPVKGAISSGFGTRIDPFTQKNKFHKGIDIACPNGSEVQAAAAGRVVYTGPLGAYGNLVIIEHQNGYRTYYGHLASFSVKTEQPVRQGDRIGLSGSTGRVTGPHLHFEVKRQGKNISPKLKNLSVH